MIFAGRLVTGLTAAGEALLASLGGTELPLVVETGLVIGGGTETTLVARDASGVGRCGGDWFLRFGSG